MIRLFVRTSLQKDALVSLDEKTQHYLLHVMRCRDKDEILCFNGLDGEWLCRLNFPNKKHLSLVVVRQLQKQRNPNFCALCPALIKKDNMDLVLQKTTELGITDIYPLITEHTVHAHFNAAHAEAVVKEAAEQCERLTLPIIHKPDRLENILKQLPKGCVPCCLAERNEGSDPLPNKGSVAFFVGPEGGWSQKELQFFEHQKFTHLHFDVGILRAETASIAILSCWQIGRFLLGKK